MSPTQQSVENLERAVLEVDALHAIYSTTDEDGMGGSDTSCLIVLSVQELEVARTILVTPDIDAPTIPQLEVEVRIPLAVGNHTSRLHLRCVMPPGYPDIPLRVEAWAADMRVSQRQDISNILNGKAKLIVGSESVMALVEDFKLLASNIFSQHETVAIPTNDSPAGRGRNFGRRWIWVHHITDTDRRKSILHQMRDMNLSGFLKYGYPGIVLIEGVSSCCDEFVAWIKGSKSRPGGFGRNWGHHVRGELEFLPELICLPSRTIEESDDMSILGRLCKAFGLEDEFLKFALQHR